MAWQDIKIHLDQAQESVRKALERLTTSREDIRLQMRAARMYNLAQRNATATSEEIFTADFGTRHPKGLDITYPDYNHAVVSMTATSRYKNMTPQEQAAETEGALGRGSTANITLHPRFYKEKSWKDIDSLLSATLSHEHVHSLQYLDRKNGWDTVLNTSYFENAVKRLPGSDMETRLKRGYQKIYQSLHKAWMAANGQDASDTEHYLAKDCEMQARLQEVLAQGYAVWQKMPTSKMELWAALHNSGLRTPPSIMEKLEESEEGQEALKRFAINRFKHRKLRFDMVGELNQVFNYAALPERREMMWEHGYPHLYGNLLELYGDRLGRERMGLGPNPRAAKELMRRFVHSPEELTDETLPALIEDIAPENALQLMKNLTFAAINDQSQMEKAALITSHLASRPDVRDHFNNMPDQTGLDMVPHPLFIAVSTGAAPVVKALLDAGVRPEADFACKHPMHSSGQMQTNSIADHLNNYRQLKAYCQSLEPDSGEKEHRERELKLFNRGLQALADHPASAEAYFTTTDLTEKKSLRELLAEVGITPSPPRPGPAATGSPAGPGG